MTRSRQSAALFLTAISLSVLPAISASAQKSKKPAASAVKDSSSVMVATVNGSKITRGEVADRLFADQLAQLDATNPQMMTAARSRPVAASVGALVMRKM